MRALISVSNKTGLVEFAGGLLTSAISLVVLFRISSTDVTLKRRLFSGTHEKLRRPAMPAPAGSTRNT